jgi:urocanate hydratase
MLFWYVNNGIARRNWARNDEAIFAIKREMKRNPKLEVTIPFKANEKNIKDLID